MTHSFLRFALGLAALAGSAPLLAQPVLVPVVTQKDLGDAAGGRLLVFAQKVEPGAKPQDEVDTSAFEPTDTAIAAIEVRHLAPGETALVDTDVDAFPAAWSKLRACHPPADRENPPTPGQPPPAPAE